MFQELIAYAEKSGLSAEPGFSPKSARWAIQCSAAGRYLGLIELGDTSRKNNPGREFAKAPDLSQGEMKSDGITKSHFLIETAGVLARYGKDGSDPKTVAKRRYFTELLERGASSMPSLEALARMMRDEDSESRLRSELEARKAATTDRVTFQIGDRFPVESSDWYEWWRTFRLTLTPDRQKTPADQMLCLLDATPAKPAATHPKITGLANVGGLAMGDLLISFKQESFCSYGFKQSANAAMSVQAAKAYQSALNHLIAKSSGTYAGTKIVHWFREAVRADEDLLGWPFDLAETQELDARDRVRQLLQSIRSGERADLADNTYYALTLSGNSGRVMIRDWMQGSFEELASNIDRWFSDFEIVHRNGGGLARNPKFGAVLGTLVRDLKDVANPMAAKLYRAAVRGEPIPPAAMAQALARTRIDLIQGEPSNHARLGLLKAYHLRKRGEMEEQLKAEVNPDLPSQAYQCGRLMAVLAKMQNDAYPKIGADVVQRYYAAASTTPALVFGRLIRGAQYHLKVIADKKGTGLAVWLEKSLGEICAAIGTSMPGALTLEEQSLFALGYYQQRSASWSSKEGKEEEK